MAIAAKHLIPVHCEQLEHGMYVAELDRSWLHTPFEVRGFLITQDEQIEVLRRCCEYVYVDPNRSDSIAMLDLAALSEDEPAIAKAHPAHVSRAEAGLPLNGCREFLEEATEHIAATVRQARRTNRLEIEPIDRTIDDFVDHVLEWPDAVQWLLATEPAHGRLNRRSIGTAVFSILFGRQLGFDHDALRELALGALLLDIGKTSVPITILSKPKRLNSVERSFVRRHVDTGVALVRLNTRMERRVVDMVASHHERIDGSGYPHRIAGTEIPLYARIAGIADTYDAMTQNRDYAHARSGHAALRYLNSCRDIKFDAALIDEFIHAVGVYPVGTNVELEDGSIGAVCRHDPDEPKRPDVLLLRDSSGNALQAMSIADSGPNQRIRRALPAAVSAH
ncbi:MAG: HD-GYP domain-containing protein [Gammaproteobacteria bacterium]